MSSQGVDANKAIDNLAQISAQQVSGLSKELAILQAQYDALNEHCEKQSELIKAYEDKEKLNAK